MISLFKMDLKHSPEGLSALQRKYLLHQLCSGKTFSTIGCEYNVNKSTIYIQQDVFKQKCASNKVMY